MTVTLTLRGMTQKGKNRIKENGVKWEQLCAPRTSKFLGDGRWVMVHPVNHHNDNNDRWISFDNDKDFQIVLTETP